MQFSKYVGCGNDFILIDHRSKFFPSTHRALIAKLCHRQFGIGADGIILLEASTIANFKMRIFNADGSEAEMCGNGIRCLFKFIKELKIEGNSFLIETMHSCLRIEAQNERVKVEMPDPTDIAWNVSLSIDQHNFIFHYLNTGVPHSVIFTDSIENVDLKNMAPKIRHHQQFSPKGTNVNYAQIESGNLVTVRTYERGVEQETLACGTGATATAIAVAKIKNIKSPILVKTRSGEILNIDFVINGNQISNVTMTGAATFIYSGRIELN